MAEDPRIKSRVWPFLPGLQIPEEMVEHDIEQGHDHDGVDSKWLEVSGVPSNPPSGKCRVLNLYVDPVTEKLIVKWDDTPEP